MHGPAQKVDTRDAKADSAASHHAIDLELFTALVAKENSIDQGVPPIIAPEIETIVIDTDVRQERHMHACLCTYVHVVPRHAILMLSLSAQTMIIYPFLSSTKLIMFEHRN